jgi:DNA-nicking Smr family endonuclease
MLRKMPLELALSRLQTFLSAKRALGTRELIVVVGKGHGSPEGKPILGPAVREWLARNPDLIEAYEEAPAREGGAGAILVRLRPSK